MLFSGDLIKYLENPKEPNEKLLQLKDRLLKLWPQANYIQQWQIKDIMGNDSIPNSNKNKIMKHLEVTPTSSMYNLMNKL